MSIIIKTLILYYHYQKEVSMKNIGFATERYLTGKKAAILEPKEAGNIDNDIYNFIDPYHRSIALKMFSASSYDNLIEMDSSIFFISSFGDFTSEKIDRTDRFCCMKGFIDSIVGNE